MLVSFILSLCVKQCQLVGTQEWKLDSESGNYKPHQYKTKSFKSMVVSYFQRVRPQCRREIFQTTGAQKKNDAYSVDDFCGAATLCLNLWDAVITFVYVKELVLLSLSKKFSKALESKS